MSWLNTYMQMTYSLNKNDKFRFHPHNLTTRSSTKSSHTSFIPYIAGFGPPRPGCFKELKTKTLNNHWNKSSYQPPNRKAVSFQIILHSLHLLFKPMSSLQMSHGMKNYVITLLGTSYQHDHFWDNRLSVPDFHETLLSAVLPLILTKDHLEHVKQAAVKDYVMCLDLVV